MTHRPPAAPGRPATGPATARPADTTVPLRRALGDSSPLAGLLARVQASKARWAACAPGLPDALRSVVRPGPLDDEGWTLLAEGSAAAAKLRQCVPSLQAALQQAGHPPLPLRVKVLPRAAAPD